jgi:hypothetical protein
MGVWPGARRIDSSPAILGRCHSGEWGDRLAEMSELRLQLRRNLSGRSAHPRQHHAGGLWPLPFYPLVFPGHLVASDTLFRERFLLSGFITSVSNDSRREMRPGIGRRRKQIEPDDVPCRGSTVAPADLLSFSIGAP